MAISRERVVAALRDASKEIDTLTTNNNALVSENSELLKKIASLEEGGSSDNKVFDFLDKEASYGEAQYLGFGKAAGPEHGSSLTIEERMDSILSGDSIN